MATNVAMVSEVSIANQALGWLGSDLITSFDDQTVNAELMRNNYPFIRDAVIEERMWTFATVRAISEVTSRDEWDVAFSHPTPLDWISVFRVFRTVSRGQSMDADRTWRMEDGKVLSENSKIFLWGVQRVSDTSKYSPMFVQCLATRIAADLAMTITENQVIMGNMWQLYGAKLKEASIRDGQQGSNEIIRSDSWISARARGGGDGIIGS